MFQDGQAVNDPEKCFHHGDTQEVEHILSLWLFDRTGALMFIVVYYRPAAGTHFLRLKKVEEGSKTTGLKVNWSPIHLVPHSNQVNNKFAQFSSNFLVQVSGQFDKAYRGPMDAICYTFFLLNNVQ